MKAFPKSRSTSRTNRGFTLFEVCLALFILVLITGSVYAVLRGTIDTATGLRENMKRRQQIEQFIRLCSRTFHMLPGTAQMESRIQSEQGKALPEVIFRKAPQLLSWGDVDDLDKVSVLGLRPQTGGRYSICLLRSSPGDDPLADPTARAQPEDWLPLVADVTKLTWRFYDSNSDNWLDILSPGQPRPRAVELNMELADEPEPIRVVFDVVPLANRVRFSLGRQNQNQNQPNQNGSNPNQPNQPNPNQPNQNQPNPNAPGQPRPMPSR